MKTVNRGKLKRLAEQGKLLARCNYCYTDDYAWDNANNFGRTKQYLPVYVIQKGESRWNVPEGYIGIDEYYFRCKGGHAWEEKDGTITLYPYQNLSYSLKIKEE